MNKKKHIFIIFLFLSSLLFSELVLYHEPPLSIKDNEEVVLILEVQDGFEETESATVFYRESGTLAYLEAEMFKGTESDPKYWVNIPDVRAFQMGIEYYFICFDKNEGLETLPTLQPDLSPFSAQIEISKIYSDKFVLLSPDKQFSDIGEDFIIAVSLFALSDEIIPNSIGFIYDGRDVTGEAKISNNLLVYSVVNAFAGKHYYQVYAQLSNGERIESTRWFTEVAKKYVKLPLNISGRAIFYTLAKSTTYDDSVGSSEDDWDSYLSLNLNGNQGIMKFKSKAYISSLNRKSQQPINRFNFEFKIPHLDFVLGDYTPNFGSFAVFGKNIQGVYSKVYFGKFAFLSVYGNLKRKIKGTSTVVYDTTATGQDTTWISYSAGTFKRQTLALRTEVGSNRSFLWGFGITKSRDDKHSISKKYFMESDSSSTTYMTSPKDNIVVSTDAQLSLFNQRFLWGVEAAVSMYNSNITDGAISIDSLEAEFEQDIPLPFDPKDISDLFVINEYIEPIIPGFSSLAYKTYLRAFFKRNLLNISYSAIGSSFNSLATNLVQKDAQILSIYDNWNLFNNKLSLNAGLNMFSDNVYDTKQTTTKSLNYSGYILYRPINLPYIKFGYTNTVSENDDDEYPYENESVNLTFSTGYKIEQISAAPTNFSLNYSNYYGAVNFKTVYMEEDSLGTMLSYDALQRDKISKNYVTLRAISKFADLPLTTTVVFSFTMNDNPSTTYVDSLNLTEKTEEESNYNSIYLKGAFSLKDDRLKPYVDFRYTAYGGDVDNQATQMFNMGVKYSILQNTFFNSEFGMKFYQNLDAEGEDYKKFNFRFKITQKF